MWTPCETGGCIGVGPTKSSALRNAIDRLESAAEEMKEILAEPV